MKKFTFTIAILSLATVETLSAAPFQDTLVQPPSIGSPQRGSLAGTMSRLAFGPGDLSRGAYSLPLPIELPTDRGPLLAKVIPSYSPETGITEWGMGWQAELSIRRYRPRGEVDFATDDFTSPWGHLLLADDGSYYPAGMASILRVTRAGDGWIATTGDGTRYHFDPSDAVTTSRGSFAWMLSRVDNILGDATTLVWTRNASGRPFLASAQWGGRGDGTQYQVKFDYEAVPTAFASYISGEKQLLDQRLARVSVGVKQGASYAPRWHYDLAYHQSPTGPAFYLEHLTRTFASGQADPPVTYDYDLNSELLASTELVHTPGLDAFIASNGNLAIQPDRAAMTDLEQNGLTDLETYYDQTTVRQTAGGFTTEALPPAAGAEPLCRPAASTLNKPRLLARMHGDASEPHVVVTKKNGFGETTRLLICDRLGVPLYDQDIANNWELGATTRLADVDLDQRPDLVRVRPGEVSILRNTSTGPAALAFTPGPVTTLSPAVTPLASWILDFNGDGRADLMVRHASGVLVWFGTGDGHFTSTGQSFGFVTTSGATLSGLSTYQFSHGDYNGDGLSDVILTRGQSVMVFINTGSAYVQVAVPGLASIPWTVTYPIVADLAGTGNESAILVDGDRAMSLQLTSPSTGLLRSADDGKGTAIRFGYGRVAPAPGIIRRYATLTSMSVESSGFDPVTYHYDYGAPVWHSLGKYLVGFEAAHKRSPFLDERVSFLNDDDIAGVPDHADDTDDRAPGIVRFTDRDYADDRYRGIRWLRPTRVVRGYRSTDGTHELATTTDYLSYERGFCATVTRTTGPNGELLRSQVLASVAAIPDDLHCEPATETLSGHHADPTRDFNYTLAIARNELGQITRATQFDMNLAMAALVLEEVDYDAAHRIASSGAPGHGTTTTSYDAVGRLAEVVEPTGVAVRSTAFDPVSDALLELQRVRPGAAVTFGYQYDGRERLRATWDDGSGTSAAQPSGTYAYRDVTATQPGRVDLEVNADNTAAIDRRSVELVGADGTTLVAGAWTGAQYALGTTTIQTRAELRTTSSFVGPRTGTAIDALTSDELRETGTPLADTTQGGFGQPAATTVTVQQGVIGETTSELVLAPGELVTRVHQPDGTTIESAVDASGMVVRKTDELAVTHRYQYDALGRLVRVETPDGAETLAFDGLGRPARVGRDGLGAITYAYDPVSGLLAQKQLRDPSNAVVHTTQTTYDTIGRATAIARSATGDTSTIALDYDGSLGNGITVPGQLGHLTRVAGDGWTRSELVDSLGRAYWQRFELADWRDVSTETTFRTDGSVAADTLTMKDGDGATLLVTTKESTLDAVGRPHQLLVDGAPLYTLGYDAEGRLARADLTAGGAVVFEYDPVTHRRSGYRVEGAGPTTGVHWDRDERGLVEGETYTAHGAATTRSYGYDPRGTLISAQSAAELATYSYTASGLPASATDSTGSRTVHRTGDHLMVGGVSYAWDAVGRVIQRGAWSYRYGASGELVHASGPGRELDFAYDETNQRVLKRVGGVPVRAEVGGGVVTEAGFIEPISIGGVVVGVLANGVFTPLLTDPRGTPFTDASGNLALASPYGVRAVHLGLAEVIDFTRLGWDADLDSVRMGVRDYDAKLGQFWTPDPLYLEHLDACQTSPLQCSLYGYAGANPISFVDPTGTDATPEVAPERQKLTFKDQGEPRSAHQLEDHAVANGDQIQTPVQIGPEKLAALVAIGKPWLTCINYFGANRTVDVEPTPGRVFEQAASAILFVANNLNGANGRAEGSVTFDRGDVTVKVELFAVAPAALTSPYYRAKAMSDAGKSESETTRELGGELGPVKASVSDRSMTGQETVATVSTGLPTVEESITLAARYEIKFADYKMPGFLGQRAPLSGTVLLGRFVLLHEYNVADKPW